jgi:NNP family nitrate/nitrite transporter-like MFS transporter
VRIHKSRKIKPLNRGIRINLPTIILLISVLFFLFTARVIYSPLLPSIERSLGLGHAQAASFFLFITIGYSAMIILSGFVASWISHRMTILLSLLLAALATLLIAASTSSTGIRLGLILLGTGAGLYPPSGILTITSLVEKQDEGKVLAMHEIGPNLGFIVAPLIVALLLPAISWRLILVIMSSFGILTGFLFLVFGRGGNFYGEPPVLKNASLILSRSTFWLATCLLALGAGASVGLYSIIPTYLVAERGLEQGLVNTLVGLSRISGLLVIIISGYLVDRFGAKLVIFVIFLAAGIATAAMWMKYQAVLISAVFLQPILITSFFPAFFTVANRIAPRRLHNLTISFILPIGYTFGAGIVPALLGLLGDHASFAAGFLIYGTVLMAASALPFLMKLREDAEE